jgi:hypothetical protein
MNKTLAMQFGSGGRVSNLPANIRLVEAGEVTDATTITITPEAGGMYLLCTKEWNASSGAYRGHRMHVVAAPEVDYFGSTACQRINTLHSDNYGVNIVYVADSSITLTRSSSTYAFRYAFYKLF